MFGADQLEHGALQVRVRDHDRRVDALAALGQHDAAHAAAFHDDALDRGAHAHLAAVGADRLDQPRRHHLAAAFGIERAAHVVIGETGREHRGRLRRPHRVVALLAEQHRLRALRESVRSEQFGDRPQAPLRDVRRRREEFAHADSPGSGAGGPVSPISRIRSTTRPSGSASSGKVSSSRAR